MKKTFALLLCLVLLLALLPGTARAEQGSALPEDTQEKIDEYVLREMARGKIPGLSIAIVHGDQLIYSAGYGSASDGGAAVTADTPFVLGSISKAFTALAIRQLANEGKIDYSAPVTRYIPWFRTSDAVESDRITILDLVNHTSGFSTVSGGGRYLGDTYSLETLVRRLDKVALNRPVGSSEEYSNLNYLVLGLVVEMVSGMPYADYIQTNIFDPLGMTQSYTTERTALSGGLAAGHRIVFGFPVETHIPFPDGNLAHGFLISSANDMATFMRLYLNNGYYGDASIIPGNELARPADPLAPRASGNPFYDVYWKPADVMLGYYGHGGATVNYRTDFIINQETRYGVVVLSNVMGDFFDPVVDAASISAGITRLLAGRVIPKATPIGVNNAGIILIAVSAAVLLFALLRLVWTRRFLAGIRAGGWRRGVKLGLMILFDLLAPIGLIVMVYVSFESTLDYAMQALPDQMLPLYLVILVLLITGIIKLSLLLREKKRTKTE